MIEFPEAFAPLFPDLSEIDAPTQEHFQFWQYAFLPGGRGGGRSRSAGAYIILRMRIPGLRALCAREIQLSIRDSVHLLLRDEIERQGLGSNGTGEFTVTDTEIRHRNGNFIIFRGLHKNIDSLKSVEGLNLVWVEEAQSVSKESLEKLIPTVIRNKGAQFIFAFNPENDTDPVWRFMQSNPPNSVICWMSLDDNPWATPEMLTQRAHDYKVDPDNAAWVWGGELRRNSDAQIFKGKWRLEEFEPRPEWDGPYFGLDFGFSQDPCFAVEFYIGDSQLWIRRTASKVGLDIDKYPDFLDRFPRSREYAIRCDCARPESISYINAHGFPKAMAAKKWTGSIEDGITWIRSHDAVVIHPDCPDIADEFKLYSFKIDRRTGDILPDVVDAHNHGIDALRYGAEPMIRERVGEISMTFW